MIPTNMLTLGDYIRNLRKLRGISQRELARLCGLSSAFVCRLEQNQFANISSNTIFLIAEALKVKPEELYFAAGYINEPRFAPLWNRPQELLSELASLMPVAIPISHDISKGWHEAPDCTYWAKTKVGGRTVKGLKVKGFSLEPLINERDIIFIEFGLSPEEGNVILCYDDEKVWLENYTGHSRHFYGVIIEVYKTLR